MPRECGCVARAGRVSFGRVEMGVSVELIGVVIDSR